MRYLDDGLFGGVAEEVFGCYTREWESALSKGSGAKVVTVESAKGFCGFRRCAGLTNRSSDQLATACGSNYGATERVYRG